MKPEPAYQVLRQRLRDEIAAGAYPDGVRLPTESELVAEHGLSRQTVRRAFQDLVAEGVVYRVPGRGTYANRGYLRQLGSIEDLMSLSEDTTMEVLQGLSRRVDVTAASRLRLDHDVVYTVVFRRLHDRRAGAKRPGESDRRAGAKRPGESDRRAGAKRPGESGRRAGAQRPGEMNGVPFVVTTVHLPESVARLVSDSAELADNAVGTNTVIGVLEPHLDQPIAEAAQSITVAPADELVAAALGCPPEHPMLRVDRLYSDTTGTPVELSVSHFLPEQYTYRVTLRRSS